MGLGQASLRPRIKPSARPRWRLPPTTSSAEATSCCATGDKPSTPSSPMPTMDSQRSPGSCYSLAMAVLMRVLILGGTTEASALAAAARRRSALRRDPVARRPHRHAAGRSRSPRASAASAASRASRASCASEAIDAVIDATHPYADQISANAVAACRADRRAAGLAGAARLDSPSRRSLADRARSPTPLPAPSAPTPRRVFLSLGRQDLHVFAAAPQHHYIARAHRAARSRRPCRPTSACCRRAGRSIATPKLRLLRDEQDRRDRLARTPAAARPTPRSRRRARSACRSS